MSSATTGTRSRRSKPPASLFENGVVEERVEYKS
jgi:hypothetical protein